MVRAGADTWAQEGTFVEAGLQRLFELISWQNKQEANPRTKYKQGARRVRILKLNVTGNHSSLFITSVKISPEILISSSKSQNLVADLPEG